MNEEEATPTAAAQPAVSTPSTPAAPAKHCGNCGAPMHGPFCYACGQPEKGMIRHLASVMADVADTIFNVDSRIFRSILPLYFRPGFLTNEYFAGRRTRYVTPFRLFFFLCVISFFAIQFSLDLDDSTFNFVGEGTTGGIERAQSAAEVDTRLQAALEGLATSRAATGNRAKAVAKLDRAEADVRRKAEQRRSWLKRRDDAVAAGRAAPPDPDVDDEDIGTLSIDGTPWDPVEHPIAIGWLPAFANAKLNSMAQHAKDNINAARKHPSEAVGRLFSVLPQTLFVLMPLFALLLKIAYIFKRRLYMEHLMVALHSHAFIFMSLLVIVTLHLLSGWATTGATWAVPVLNLLRAAAWTWLPIYLFLMARRVYHQGWFMTTFKFCLVGFCYLFLLGFGLAGAAIASLTIV
ncbi:MAG: DUF3667 domain-containing protein [Dokdonella sp.]|uniref:DUF3667 domain-containing protein n=1 Tax=Dokdonella sp. TaxID=2291710 RepID=UPI003F81060F